MVCCVHITHLNDPITLQLCHIPITSLAPKTKMDTHDTKAVFWLYCCNLLSSSSEVDLGNGTENDSIEKQRQ